MEVARTPSRFLEDIPGELLKLRDATTPRVPDETDIAAGKDLLAGFLASLPED